MESSPWRGFTRITLSVVIGMLSLVALLTTMSLLLTGPSFAEVAGVWTSDRADDMLSPGQALSGLNGISPTIQLLAFQPSESGYLFTIRLSDAPSHTQYVISSYHHTDIDYWQDAVTVTTDISGVASARVWSRCTYQDVLTGYVFAQLEQASVFQAESNHLDCPALQTIGDFGLHLVTDPANDDWIYRPSPPGTDSIRIWVLDAAGRTELTGTCRPSKHRGKRIAH